METTLVYRGAMQRVGSRGIRTWMCLFTVLYAIISLQAIIRMNRINNLKEHGGRKECKCTQRDREIVVWHLFDENKNNEKFPFADMPSIAVDSFSIRICAVSQNMLKVLLKITKLCGASFDSNQLNMWLINYYGAYNVCEWVYMNFWSVEWDHFLRKKNLILLSLLVTCFFCPRLPIEFYLWRK